MEKYHVCILIDYYTWKKYPCVIKRKDLSSTMSTCVAYSPPLEKWRAWQVVCLYKSKFTLKESVCHLRGLWKS